MRAGVKRQVCTTLATPNFSGSIQWPRSCHFQVSASIYPPDWSPLAALSRRVISMARWVGWLVFFRNGRITRRVSIGSEDKEDRCTVNHLGITKDGK